MTVLRISLMGDVSVSVDATAHVSGHLRSLQARVVLAMLVLERPRPVHRDELATLLWGDERPASWESVLRTAVARVRATLADAGPGARASVRTAFGCYQLRVPDATEVDVEQAAADIAYARGLPPADAARLLERAARLARQPFLPESDRDWVRNRRTGLRAVRVRALEALCEARMAEGRAGEAATVATELVELDQFNEPAHRLLVTALARGGNRAQALLAYERCRRLLADELGVDPSPETKTTYIALLTVDVPRADLATVGGIGRSHVCRSGA
jgi:DNA-binding SARP family transcriptional activator